METKFFFRYRNSLAIEWPHRKPMHKQTSLLSVQVAVMKENTHHKAATSSDNLKSPSIHHDNFIDLMAINHVSHCLQSISGIESRKNGYDGFLEVTTAVSKNFSPVQQQKLVLKSLEKAIPTPILMLAKAIMPQTRFSREFFAKFTTLFFAWLVGYSEVRESEIHGRREKNVVHINKCRFLESCSCIGMCMNLCKFPTQTFIKDSLGMPVNMVPNFDDMSCEMRFGEEPLAPEEDPVLQQPCYKQCTIKKEHSRNCLS